MYFNSMTSKRSFSQMNDMGEEKENLNQTSSKRRKLNSNNVIRGLPSTLFFSYDDLFLTPYPIAKDLTSDQIQHYIFQWIIDDKMLKRTKNNYIKDYVLHFVDSLVVNFFLLKNKKQLFQSLISFNLKICQISKNKKNRQSCSGYHNFLVTMYYNAITNKYTLIYYLFFSIQIKKTKKI